MAQNITLLGASYVDVPAVTLPKTGGGEATFTDVTPTTAAAADVASGKQFFDALGVLTQGTASGGGGGASNVVTGTFKGTTTDAAMDVTIPYTGSGWPVAVTIYPTEGSGNSSGTFGSLIQRYAFSMFSATKLEADQAPIYARDSSSSTSKDKAQIVCCYKSSTSSATSYTGTYNTSRVLFTSTEATNTSSTAARFKSATKMSVFIASTSWGFAANIDYTYVVLYSS